MIDAGIVHQDIKSVECVLRKTCDIRRRRLIHIGEIGLNRRRLAAHGLDFSERVFGLMAAIGQRNIGPGGGKAKGDALANAGCAAGHQSPATGKVKRVCHRQYRFAMGRSSAGKSEMTSQPVSVTTTSSSIRAAE